MSPPKIGETITCYACRRGRLVTGIETGWPKAEANCRNCPWKYHNAGTRRRLFARAHAHADAREHRVAIENDGRIYVIKPKVGQQMVLIDDLLLPE